MHRLPNGQRLQTDLISPAPIIGEKLKLKSVKCFFRVQIRCFNLLASKDCSPKLLREVSAFWCQTVLSFGMKKMTSAGELNKHLHRGAQREKLFGKKGQFYLLITGVW